MTMTLCYVVLSLTINASGAVTHTRSECSSTDVAKALMVADKARRDGCKVRYEKDMNVLTVTCDVKVSR